MSCPAATGVGYGDRRCAVNADGAHRCQRPAGHLKSTEPDHACSCGFLWTSGGLPVATQVNDAMIASLRRADDYGDLQAPHCDSAILHAPGECGPCDQRPGWQALRMLWGITFTGHKPKVHMSGGHAWQEIACPSDIRRPGNVAGRWPGNVPRSRGGRS